MEKQIKQLLGTCCYEIENQLYVLLGSLGTCPYV